MRFLWILLIALAGALAGYLFTRFEGTPPGIQTRTGEVFVGAEHLHELHVSDKGTGVESVRVWLESGGGEHELLAERFPGNVFLGARLNVTRRLDVAIRPAALGIADGRATLHVEARDWSWQSNATRAEVPLVIDTRAPRVSLETGLTYVRRGGVEATVYRVDEEPQSDGVRVGEQLFPGFSHPKRPGWRIAFYAIPPELPQDARPELVARDRAGNEAGAALSIEVIDRSFPADQIELTMGFMERKVSELGGSSNGDTLEAYLAINRDMRRENAEKIREICSRSSGEALWRGPFLQLPNSQVQAHFAEQRTYLYEGRKVDEQVHNGYDFAATAHSRVPAANDGLVVFADDLGIYGNTVILDHGLGVFSLYGHLADFAVEKGDTVARGDPLGHTGSTGLAGGDHLHFSILVAGVFVDPTEWMDGLWIREHIEPKLAAATASEE